MRRLTERRRFAADYNERRDLSRWIHETRVQAKKHMLDSFMQRALERGAMRELRMARRPAVRTAPEAFEGSQDCEVWTGLLQKTASAAMQRGPETEVDQAEVVEAASSPEMGELSVTAADIRPQAGCMQVGSCAGADGLVAEALKLQNNQRTRPLRIHLQI